MVAFLADSCLKVLAISLRYWIWATPSLMAALFRRGEISTPLNSWLRLKEGVFLFRNDVSPYDGDLFHQHPLLLWTFRYLIVNWSDYLILLFIAFDILTAVFLASSTELYLYAEIKKQDERKKTKQQADDVASILIDKGDVESLATAAGLLYLFNPFSIASCVSQTVTVIDNLLLAAVLYFALSERKYLCMFVLSLSAMFSFYPVILLVFVAVHFGKLASKNFDRQFWSEVALVVSINSLMIGIFTFLTIDFLWGSTDFLDSLYGFTLSVSELTPNTGIFWYFLTEMFDHFRLFFVWVFQLNIFVYVLPLAITLRNDTWLLYHQYIMLIAIFKSYPCVGDVAFYMALLPSFKHFYKSSCAWLSQRKIHSMQLTVALENPGHPPEWVIVELQGTLESHSGTIEPGSFIGDLEFTDDKTPELRIGHHLLTGKVVKLEKPLAVMERRKGQLVQSDLRDAHQSADVEMEEATSSDANENGKKEPDYVIKAVVRRKLVFKSRPKPIVSMAALASNS